MGFLDKLSGSGGMTLRLESDDKKRKASEELIRSSLSSPRTMGEFAILERDDDNFMQTAANDDGSLLIEYRGGASGIQYQCSRSVTRKEAIEAFVLYFRGGSEWKDTLDWRPMDLDAPEGQAAEEEGAGEAAAMPEAEGSVYDKPPYRLSPEELRGILESGVDPNKPIRLADEDADSGTSAHVLLEYYTNDINGGSAGDMWDYEYKSHLPRIKVLLEHGADPNRPYIEHDEGNALIDAVTKGHEQISYNLAKLFLEAGADPHAAGEDGLDALDLVQHPRVRELLERYAEEKAGPKRGAGKAAPKRAASGAPCPSCGAAVSADDKFCAQCGSPLAPKPRFCISCGAELQPGARFCPSCGTKAP